MEKKVVKVDGVEKEVFACYADDMHPYNCDGMFGGSCIHCEEKESEDHKVATCALCRYFDD
jgi:hypothetical protein